MSEAAEWVALRCRSCGEELGLTTDRVLLVGDVLVRQPVTLCCARCGKRRHWRPLPNKAETERPNLQLFGESPERPGIRHDRRSAHAKSSPMLSSE